MHRVVVEEQQPVGLGAAREGERGGERRVPPADVVRVLLVAVLAVVHEQAGALGEVEAGNPLRVDILEPGPDRRLVVGDVAERGVALGDPVAERGAAVGDGCRAHGRRPDLPLDVGSFAKGHVAGQLPHLDR
jgi:hypothetical protein